MKLPNTVGKSEIRWFLFRFISPYFLTTAAPLLKYSNKTSSGIRTINCKSGKRFTSSHFTEGMVSFKRNYPQADLNLGYL
ncbi:hypothetical protein AYI68_g6962 [Smittium mucronatum]|uniref:Uncharacterized protein n=1 Tax=Smittium mucronatum TaxID=133383 RepID=A0A1R0GQ11_9FUNG|nr:hypothetical protein AYI68_g6962 [Smittium mucronatum]